MVKHFVAEVSTFSVIIWNRHQIDKYHYEAIVDGEEYRYKVVNGEHLGKLKQEAWGRASVAIHYHAKNAGNIVRFKPVTTDRKKSSKKKIDEKQKGLF